MNRIIRYFNQNRRKIITIVIAIVFLLIIIQILNAMAKQNKLNKENQIISKENKEYLPTESIITGEKVDVEVTRNNKNVIEEFVKYCNEKNTAKAYELLAQECKETLFKTEQDFIDYYYNIIFTEKRLINIKNFRNTSTQYTYVVEYYNDVLTTGKNPEAEIYTDYITINKETEKININNFISSKKINKTDEYNGIKIEVKEQQIYKNYEKYVVSVQNTTDKKILLDTRKDSRSMYVLGSNNVKYSAFANEISSNIYEIPAYVTRTYTIKYDKIYNPSIVSRKIGFTDIVTNYEKYKQNPNEENKKDKHYNKVLETGGEYGRTERRFKK